MSIKWNKIEPNNELDKKLYETFTSKLRKGYAEFGDEKTVMSIHYVDIAEKCTNAEVKDTDIFVASYPKTGTTWTQEMVWMIINNLDFEGAKRSLIDRFPFMEYSGLYTFEEALKIDPDFKLHPVLEDSLKYVANLKDPRFIKTHLPWSLLPKQITNGEKTPKIIHVTRNAKDTCVSYYYHCIFLEGYNGDFETFCELFLGGRLNNGDYSSHILSYWKRRNLPNILFIRYEEMKTDLSAVIKKVASFLNKFLTEAQIQILEKHLSFEAMKKNPAVDISTRSKNKFFDNNALIDDKLNFFRSGTVGGYKKEMTPDIEKMFDDWIQESFQGTDFEF